MTKVLRGYLIVLLLSAFAVGCDKQVSDYVDGVKRKVPEGSGENEPMSFKITPGKLNSPTTNGGAIITGTVTPTNQFLPLDPTASAPLGSTSMSMSVTMSRQRVTPQ